MRGKQIDGPRRIPLCVFRKRGEDFRKAVGEQKRSQVISPLNLIPGRRPSFSKSARPAFQLRKQRFAVRFLALFDKSLDAFVSMQQIGEGFIRPSLALSREFLKNPVGFLVEIDFPPHHAVGITHRARGKNLFISQRFSRIQARGAVGGQQAEHQADKQAMPGSFFRHPASLG
jgi:hypothetical protein